MGNVECPLDTAAEPEAACELTGTKCAPLRTQILSCNAGFAVGHRRFKTGTTLARSQTNPRFARHRELYLYTSVGRARRCIDRRSTSSFSKAYEDEPLQPSRFMHVNDQAAYAPTRTKGSGSFLRNYRGERVLVTGGAGFIGSHLVEALVSAGARVRVLDNFAEGRPENLAEVMPAVDLWQEDIRNDKAVRRAVEARPFVFHLAANASVPRSVENPGHDFECNALGTLNLLSALKQSRPRSCVFVSSGAVYGQPTKFPITEEDHLTPISPYGAGKMAAEGLCRAFHASYGVPVQIARVFNTYGPRQPRFVMYDFYKKLRQDPRRLEILGSGSQVRDFCYVTDTVDAILRLGLQSGDISQAFNVASGVSYSVTNVAIALIQAMHLTEVAISYSGTSWLGDAERWEVSIDKVRQASGYSPRYTLEQGLEEFVTWFDRTPQRLHGLDQRGNKITRSIE